MLKKVFKIITLFIFGMAGGIFADQIFWPYFVERPLFYQYDLQRPPVYVAETKEIIIRENVALQEAILKVEKAVVGVRTQTAAGRILEGSGLIATSDGLMVTLAELVPAGSDFTFFVEGKTQSYRVLKRDPENNLALIKLEGANFTTVGFADFAKLRLGERVFLVGTIFEEGAPQKIANEGIIKIFDQNSIQTNISESPILSVSPLFNIEGKVLGLATIDRAGKVSAIPITKIRTFLGL